MNEPLNNCITMALVRALIMREDAKVSRLPDDSDLYRDSIAIERVANELKELRRQRWAN